MIGRRWSARKLHRSCTEAGGVSSGHDGCWSRPEKTTEHCRSSGSRPEEGSINDGNGGQDGIAGSSTKFGGRSASDERAGATIRAQRLAREDRSAAEATSRDRRLNPNLLGQGTREEEI